MLRSKAVLSLCYKIDLEKVLSAVGGSIIYSAPKRKSHAVIGRYICRNAVGVVHKGHGTNTRRVVTAIIVIVETHTCESSRIVFRENRSTIARRPTERRIAIGQPKLAILGIRSDFKIAHKIVNIKLNALP